MKVMVAFLGKKKERISAREFGDAVLRDRKSITSPKERHRRSVNDILTRETVPKRKIGSITNIGSPKFIGSKNKKRESHSHRWDDIGRMVTNETQKMSQTFKSIPFTKVSFLVFLLIPIFVYVMGHFHLNTALYPLATNLRQASDKKIQISDLVGMYGIYNKDNYSMKQNAKDEKVVTASTENQSDIDLIDSLVNTEEAQAVFGKKDVEAHITDETKTLQRVNVDTFKILNYSGTRNIDFTGIMNSNITLTKGSDKILLYNTHTSESYANSEGYQFEYDGTMRSRDASYNMIAIAKSLSENLKSKGFEVFQDTTPHDYGTYTSAYSLSRKTIQSDLAKMGGAGIMIDVHRDATADLGFRPVANIKGVQVAQLMFVMGVGTDTTKNPHWEENLKLAMKIQQIADKIYPGLFRPMMIRNSVYNQDLNKYSLLVECGATGNTIEEVKLATRCLTNLLNIVYKD